MLKVRIVSVGKVRERYLLDGIAEYAKRLSPYCRLEILELKDEGVEKEGARISRYLCKSAYVLDEKGKQYTSREFAAFMKKQEGEITFIIGSAEGVSGEVKGKATGMISLSNMTFTHDMCRLFFIEQLYRAFMINSNRSYQK